jgi:uncharacterized protein YkwD
MFHSNWTARFSRPQVRFSLFTLILLTVAFSAPNISAQSSAAQFVLTGVRLPVPTSPAKNTSYAHPMARLVGSTERADLPRAYRSRIVLLDTNANAHTATTAIPAPVGSAGATSQEQRVLQLINKLRTSRGLKTLDWDSTLLRAARMHSENMAKRDFFNHVGPDGKTATERIKMCGLRGWRALGENIHFNQGYDDPVAFAIERWMASPLHRQNMLNPMWSSSAVGIATASDGRIFFTELFLAR